MSADNIIIVSGSTNNKLQSNLLNDLPVNTKQWKQKIFVLNIQSDLYAKY